MQVAVGHQSHLMVLCMSFEDYFWMVVVVVDGDDHERVQC